MASFHHQIVGAPALVEKEYGARAAHRPTSARIPTPDRHLKQRPSSASGGNKVSFSSRPPPSGHSFAYGAHGIWREAPIAPPPAAISAIPPSAATPRANNPSPRTKPPLPQPALTTMQHPAAAAPPFEPPQDASDHKRFISSTDPWGEILRPAIAWLFGFIDTEMSMVEGSASKEILAEHHRALEEMSRQVGSVLRASPGGNLAASLWRATVALLTTFAGRAEPLMGKLRALQREAAAARVLDAKHAAEHAAWDRERAELQAQAAGSGTFNRLAMRRQSSVGARGRRKSSFMARRHSTAVGPGQSSPGGSPGQREATLLAKLAESHGHLVNFGPDAEEATVTEATVEEEDDDEEEDEEADELSGLEKENSELHEQMVEVRRELVQERYRNANLQSTVEALHEKLMARAALSRIQDDAGGGDGEGELEDDEEAASGEDADADADSDDSDRPKQKPIDGWRKMRLARRVGQARRPTAAEKEVAELKEDLQRMEELFHEAERLRSLEVSRRQVLEGLRTEVARRFSQAFVKQLEQELAAQALRSRKENAAAADGTRSRRPSSGSVGGGRGSRAGSPKASPNNSFSKKPLIKHHSGAVAMPRGMATFWPR